MNEVGNIGTAISRVRNMLKAVKDDPFITDRFIYSLINKNALFLMKQEDSYNKLLKFQSFFKSLPCVELIEVDKIEACCSNVTSGITIMRTKDKIPKLMEASFGPLIRSVTSIDGSQEAYITQPSIYAGMSKTSGARYNKNKYYWYLNDYLYFPNIQWEAVKVEGIFEDDISDFLCDSCEQRCVPMQDKDFQIPEYLFAQIEQNVIKDLTVSLQIPSDAAVDDNQNILR
jgi:hypothetical protein